MSPARIRLIGPEKIGDFVRSGQLNEALLEIARLGGTELSIEDPQLDAAADNLLSAPAAELPICYRGQALGRLLYDSDHGASSLERTAHALTKVLQHALEREMAVGDLAEAMLTSFEEQNMFYSLLPNVTARLHPSEIGEVLVDETARTLNCRRVSLLTLDEDKKVLRMLASRGLPAEARRVSIPVSGTVAGHALDEDDLLVVNDLSQRPDLAALSRGRYETDSFVVVRVPLRARGEAVGVLTATERNESAEFTARDRKLLDGLSAIGASALLNCRLHAAVNQQMMGTIRSLASAVDAKDQYTHDHSGRVAHLCVATARELGITDAAACREVELAGLLHDIGKIGIPDAILSKSGRLAPEEFARVKSHVRIGAGIVEHVRGLDGVARAILHHHERYDGLGYPGGLAGDAIPLASKLIAVADVFDSMTSDRPYRQAVARDEAVNELIRCKGTQLDPDVVDAFIVVINTESPSDARRAGHVKRRHLAG